MHLFLHHDRRHATLLRRCIGWLLLVVISVGLFGMPLPRQTVQKTGRFPCEDCPCGCSTAEYCWDKCCCHTDAEKLQWAADHGVDAPAFLVQRIQDAGSDVRLLQISPATGKTSACCCCKPSNVGEPTSPSLTCAVETTDGDSAPSSETTVAPRRMVLLVDAARCRGIELAWSIFGQASVDTGKTLFVAPLPPVVSILAVEDDRCDGRSMQPEPPVPWCV